MALELIPSTHDHSDEIARICHEAYKDLTDRHHFPPMFPSTGVARQAFKMILDSDFSYGVTAMVNGEPVGSAIMWLMDEVAAIGPVSMEPSFQGQSVARPMMEYLLDYAHRNDYEMVRLSQRSYNPVSLSLYAKVGFNTVESFMEMRPSPRPDSEEAVRPFIETDFPAIEMLSKRNYKVNRSSDLRAISQFGGNTLVRDSGKGLTGYLACGPGLGHGVAETDEDILALVGEAAIRFPDSAKFNCPLSNGNLYRKFLEAGCRAVEVHTLMAYGPYEQPEGVWLPSGGY